MTSSPVPYMTERVPCAPEALPQAMSWLGAPDHLSVCSFVAYFALYNNAYSDYYNILRPCPERLAIVITVHGGTFIGVFHRSHLFAHLFAATPP
jgi:hypothetical protein